MDKKVEVKSGITKFISAILLIVAVVIVAIVVYNSNPSSKEISYTQYTTMITSGNIKEITIENNRVNIVSTDNERFWFYNRGEYLEEDLKSDVETFNYLVDNNSAYASYSKITLKYGTASTFSILDILFPLLSFGLMAFFVILLLKRIGKTNSQSFDFVKNRARIIPSNVKFDSVAGLDEEKEEVKEIIEFLRNPKKFIDIGARIPKGVLLEGAPGTGKTLLAKAIAGEAEVPFFSISGSDFMELFVGVGASRVRDLFENAKKAKPCIVFIDEIDAVGRQRGTGMGGGNDEREQTLNQLLVQMDGFEENEGIIVIAATNRADILDPAILRPGRFDRRIHIHIPDVKGREEILKVHAKNKPLESDVDLKTVARITSGFTGADLENLLNESAIIAAKENRTKINMTDVNNGIVKVTMGPQKRSRIVSDKDKRITAIHESGHAVIERLVENSNPVHEISIVPRGSAGGYTLSRPDNDDEYMSKSKLIDTITMMLGGRTAERMFLSDFTTGACNDIERATQIARKMVTEWGMSDEIGYVCLGSQTSYFLGRDYQERVNYSEQEAALIDAEIKKIMDSCAKKAEEILSKHKPEIETMVSVLLEKETIYSDEINMIIEGKTKEEVIAFIDSKSAPKTEEKPEEEVKEDKTLDELLEKAEERKKAKTVPKNRPTNIKIEEEDQIKINEIKANEQTKETSDNKAEEKPAKKKTEKTKKDAE